MVFYSIDEARLLSNARKKIPDSISIAVEVVDRDGQGITLNEDLHAN